MWVHLCGNIIFHLHRVLQTVCVGNLAGRLLKTLQEKKKNLDETGLEIAGCRHGLAQWAVNMFQGEIYGYANYIQAKKMLPAGVRFFWEDIVCRYWKWASKIGREETKTMRPALSVMHAKAHKWSCQVYLFDSVDNNYSDFDSGVGVD